MIKFTIAGKPKPLKRHRVARNGRMYDPSSKDKKDIWLQIARYKPIRPFAGSIRLSVRFTMPIPKSRYRTGKYKHLLKDKYKGIRQHTVKPDLDNLLKMICDVMNNGYYIDDSQICEIYAEKIYGENPNTAVIIEEIN